MCETQKHRRAVAVAAGWVLGYGLMAAQNPALAGGDPFQPATSAYARYQRYDGGSMPEVEAAMFTRSIAGRAVVAPAGVSTAAEPIAGSTVASVSAEGNGRYTVRGVALDKDGNPACALALASGRCVFTCGPGSGRCEGGSASLPLGEFELSNLPTESDGSIALQIFVQGHISHKRVIATSDSGSTSQARWGTLSNLCCPSAPSTLTVIVDGTKKQSVIGACGSGDPTWEGWVSTTPGTKDVVASQVSEGCPQLDYTFTQELVAGQCLLFVTDLEGGNPVMTAGQVDCTSLP